MVCKSPVATGWISTVYRKVATTIIVASMSPLIFIFCVFIVSLFLVVKSFISLRTYIWLENVRKMPNKTKSFSSVKTGNEVMLYEQYCNYGLKKGRGKIGRKL